MLRKELSSDELSPQEREKKAARWVDLQRRLRARVPEPVPGPGARVELEVDLGLADKWK